MRRGADRDGALLRFLRDPRADHRARRDARESPIGPAQAARHAAGRRAASSHARLVPRKLASGSARASVLEQLRPAADARRSPCEREPLRGHGREPERRNPGRRAPRLRRLRPRSGSRAEPGRSLPRRGLPAAAVSARARLRPAPYAAPPPPAAPYASPFAPGTRVLVQWADGNRYPGTVHHVAPGAAHFLILFPDGQQRWVEPQYLTPAR